MNQKGLLVLVSVVLWGCVLIATSCASSDARQAGVPSGWVTFKSASLSLALPDSFSGGDPRDPKVLASLEAIAAHSTDAKAAQVAHDWLEGIRPLVAEGSYIEPPDLAMLDQPDPQGRLARVEVSPRTPVDGWSIKEYVNEMRIGFPDLTVESMTQDRAWCLARLPIPGSTEGLVELVVFVMRGEQPYTVTYIWSEGVDQSMGPIFRESAKTIVVAA
jgi:hypothetical protein